MAAVGETPDSPQSTNQLQPQKESGDNLPLPTRRDGLLCRNASLSRAAIRPPRRRVRENRRPSSGWRPSITRPRRPSERAHQVGPPCAAPARASAGLRHLCSPACRLQPHNFPELRLAPNAAQSPRSQHIPLTPILRSTFARGRRRRGGLCCGGVQEPSAACRRRRARGKQLFICGNGSDDAHVAGRADGGTNGGTDRRSGAQAGGRR